MPSVIAMTRFMETFLNVRFLMPGLTGMAVLPKAEIDIRQNRIMQILTIVTTIFLPLTLLVGWYGMNFAGMPELTWKYGYPVIVVVSIVIVGISLWVCKRKKFW